MSKEFSYIISSENLSKGLRTSERAARDTKFLVEAKGAIGRDGVLCAIDQLTRFSTTGVTDTFPFPQLFVFVNFVLVCGLTKIYELKNGVLTLVHTASIAGSTWSAVDFYSYAYLTNGKVTVVRSPDTDTYSESAILPTGMSLCNFNGQVIVGAPSINVNGASLSMKAGTWTATMSLTGTWS